MLFAGRVLLFDEKDGPARQRAGPKESLLSLNRIGQRFFEFAVIHIHATTALVFAFSRVQAWGATRMRAFSPITICLNRNLTVVASIADAMKVLQQPWPRMGKPGRLKAIRMVEESLAGHCSQQAAFEAFKAAAAEQGLLRTRGTSTGLGKCARMVEDLM
ncbi:DUF982 domain-containing protein [Mesorhizobium sp. M0199]|uniref:DUF982 domain-containing protein n=1 Tax=Mesorhizobium sp. M0199 TaxID=2956911 RepID=UPI00333D3AE1